ncbi:DoxX family protein [Taibaiella koreensis]|uniref:hypothetical protein n=1 Tax=Taibaiella koreensis TaxID=1268548 RepID=UPI000E5997F0|nr:hypothetical protein [Taibaiella koreensis]
MEKERIKNGARILLGAALVFAGSGHRSFARKAFCAQVPDWVPLKKDDTVVYSFRSGRPTAANTISGKSNR